MGICNSSPETKRNQKINKGLRQWSKIYNEEVKLLLLGPGESGKSTIFKQMKIIGQSGYTEEDRIAYRFIIHANIISQIKILLLNARKHNIEVEEKNKKAANYLLTLPNGGDSWSPEIGVLIKQLWNDEGIKRTYEMRDKGFVLNENTSYFLGQLDRIVTHSYIPSVDDVLRSRVRTTGIEEAEFVIEDFTFRLTDVGGQRSERRKWIHCICEGTPVTLDSGLSVAIDKLNDRDSSVLGYDSPLNGMIPSQQTGFWNNGERECIELALEDGRTLTCTPEHKILTCNGTWMEAKDLVDGESRVKCSLRGVFVDIEEEMRLCRGWGLKVEGVSDFECATKSGYSRSLAFARILGYLFVNGISSGDRNFKVVFDHEIDVGRFKRDLDLVEENLGSSFTIVEDGSKFVVIFKGGFFDSISSSEFPQFIRDCPKPILREFLAGLFGDCSDIVDLPFISFSESNCQDVELIRDLLGSIGIDKVRVDSCQDRQFVAVEELKSFSERIGFRYSCNKAHRLETKLCFGRNSGDFIGKSSKCLPTLDLRVMSKRSVGLKKVYDIGIENTHSFVSNGVVVHNCFDNVTAVLFCMSLSGYDQVLREDDKKNRMDEALDLFREVNRSAFFETTDFILFMNKKDLFEEKIVRKDLSCCFPNYTGGLDKDKALEFIKLRFKECNSDRHKLYMHQTCAINTENIEVVFKAVKKTILEKVLTLLPMQP